ncbi:MAG: hypothetical protein M1838_005517 [Thelocarpon superellum]|nr:MAG: hypothetical protein M1838_005517 [Thelocarpon superellum]
MADRYPSIEELSAGQTDLKGGSGLDIDAPSSTNGDFLTRERAALGDEADQFATPHDSLTASALVEDAHDDLLGGGVGAPPSHAADSGISSFESSFPAIDTSNERVAPGGTITGSNEPFPSSYTATAEDEEEPEVIKAWRERRDAALAQRSTQSESRKVETVKSAQQAVDDFYENYNTKKEKMIAQTRKEAEEFLASREDTAAGGTSWERIAKLVDLSGKGGKGGGSGTGKERFRELLVRLKKDEKAPGATGY